MLNEVKIIVINPGDVEEMEHTIRRALQDRYIQYKEIKVKEIDFHDPNAELKER